MKTSELIKQLTAQLSLLGDKDIDIPFNSELYQYLNPLEQKAEKFKISIGDWSHDGHNQSDQYYFWSLTPLIDIQNAFKESCKKYGLIFDCNNDLDIKSEYDYIFCDYEDCQIKIELLSYFQSIGIDVKKYFDYEDSKLVEYNEYINSLKDHEDYKISKCNVYFKNIDLMPDFIMDIAKLSMKFEYEPASHTHGEKIKPFNGWWTDNEMNIGIGYGLYCL